MNKTIENLKKLKSFHNGSYGADIDKAIKALEQEPCEDAISREEAFEGLNSINGTSELDKAFEVIENLPPVTPTRKKRHCKALEQEPVLDKIRAEIEKQEKWLMGAGYNAYNVDIAFDAIKAVMAESEDKV